MTGGTRKRNETWSYYFDLGKVDGKRKKKEKGGFKTKKEAEMALRKAMLEYENSGLSFEPSEISVSDYLDYWFKEYVLLNCKPNTTAGYKSIIENHLKPILGSYKLKSLTPSTLQEFINNKFILGYSKNMINNIFTLLGGSLKYAVYPCQFLKDSPMQYIKIPRYDHIKKQSISKIINKEDFRLIINRFPQGSKFYIMLMIGYYTGARIGEITALTWEDIDLKNETIDFNKNLYKNPDNKQWYLGSTKTESSVRKIKIGATLVNILDYHYKQQIKNKLKYQDYYMQQYIKTDIINNKRCTKLLTCVLKLGIPQGYTAVDMVNTMENGKIVTFETFKYASRVIHYELNIAFNFHSLRHTHATMLIENGANMKDVQERLGHALLTTTMDTYTHVTDDMKNNTVNIFEKFAAL